jgi:hypothetical protein
LTDIWIYRLDVFMPEQSGETVPDLVGFEVVTTDDQKIGKVDQATNDGGKLLGRR